MLYLFIWDSHWPSEALFGGMLALYQPLKPSRWTETARIGLYEAIYLRGMRKDTLSSTYC